MFKSSKSIELNGTSAKGKPGKVGDGKGGSVPSSPMSITVSSSKKADCSRRATEQEMNARQVRNETAITNSQTTVSDSSLPALASSVGTGDSPAVPQEPRPSTKPAEEKSSLTSPEDRSISIASASPASVNKQSEDMQDGIWSPKQTPKQPKGENVIETKSSTTETVVSTPIWKPHGSTQEEKVLFRSTKTETVSGTNMEVISGTSKISSRAPILPVKRSCTLPEGGTLPETPITTIESPIKDVSSTKAPLSPTFVRLNGASHLPRSQSPTITLLQKRREGQIRTGAMYIDPKMNSEEHIDESASSNISSTFPPHNDNLFRVKSAEIHDDYRKIHLEPIVHQGIGPTNEQGIPISLRTGVTDESKGDWYKKMYKSLHRLGDSSEDDYVVVKYRRRGRIPYSGSGYMSEPEPDRDDYHLIPKCTSLDRRKLEYDYSFEPKSKTLLPTKGKSVFSAWTPPSAKYSYLSDVYKNQPRKIEDYEPGHSSIAEREAKLDEDGVQQESRFGTPGAPSTSSYIFKDGYESDSTLVYKKHGFEPPSINEQRLRYREIQRGGDIPLTGLRRTIADIPKEPPSSSPVRLSHSTSLESTSAPYDLSLLPPVPAPPPKIPLVDGGSESPHRYLESEVNIHYKAPIRSLEKEFIEEEELKQKQEEMMKQFYEEEKRKKFLQELNDMENRRHSDNFIPSQKSPIPLDRYDNPYETSVSPQPRARTPEPKTVARARYTFAAQNARELSFNKGDIIIINRRIDSNWFEGEHHGMIGLFPVNHVEIIPYDKIRATPKKINEGLAKAKYHFRAQTSLELPLVKGELVILTRRVDRNWYMGRIGGREGIIPVSYMEVIREPGDVDRSSSSPIPKPGASPISRPHIINGSSNPTIPRAYTSPSYYNQKLNSCQNPYATMRRYAPIRPPEPTFIEKKQPVDQSLHIDTQSEPIPYRALYDYQPQNEDELELRESDTVFVMEKCDDGWYVGSSLRSGFFGTFPGNYVERM